MTASTIAIVCAIGFATAFVGVITGANSLVTVPVLLLFGMYPRVAVATNMFAVGAMTAMASARFFRAGLIDRRHTGALFAITLVTSAIGARLTVTLPDLLVRGIVGVSLVVMLVFLVAQPRLGDKDGATSPLRRAIGLLLSAVLGIYGGLFSGGYTTLLTLVCIGCFGMKLMPAVGLTKLVNLVSCAVAVVVFFFAHLIDFRVGVPMAIAMGAGGFIGAEVAIERGHKFVRVIFLVVVAVLAAKVLIYDLLLRS